MVLTAITKLSPSATAAHLKLSSSSSSSCRNHISIKTCRNTSVAATLPFLVSANGSHHSPSTSTYPSGNFSSSVGSPTPLLFSPPPHRNALLLNIAACCAAVSASWLFISAIPTLLAFKKAAESLEKLLDTAREELPDTMAAVRLSGMEISDLTMELSDLGQEITQGVRSSTRAVRVAEDRLRRLTAMSPAASVQVQAMTTTKMDSDPALARSARNLREGIAKGRALFSALSSLSKFSRMAWNFLTARRRTSSP